MARRLIGTGTTNASGIASITYTGTGAGKLHLIAESGDLKSSTYEITDAKYIDDGVNRLSMGCVSEIINGITKLSGNGENYGLFVFSRTTSSSTDFYISEGECFELTMMGYEGVIDFRLKGTEQPLTSIFSTVKNSQFFAENTRVKIMNEGEYIRVYLNGSDTASKSVKVNGSDSWRTSIRINVDAILYFKDLIYY